ncbi:SPRY domain-containing SOCS box protein 1-like [Neosynchiropus ocellatus]
MSGKVLSAVCDVLFPCELSVYNRALKLINKRATKTQSHLFAPMGLSLSVWLIKKVNGPPPCTSVFSSLAAPTPSRLQIILNSSPTVEDNHSHWSAVHRSPHFLVSPCKQKVTRSPVELSSDGVRAEEGVMSGLHVWEVLWDPCHRGSHAVIGISTKNCPLQASGYKVLVGGDKQSWGWELKTNKLWHDGRGRDLYPGNGRTSQPSRAKESRRDYVHSKVKTEMFPIPKCVLMVLDIDAGNLGYVVDGFFLGVAFKGLPHGVEMFPAVSSVRGGAQIRLRYLNGAAGYPPSLMSLCRLSIQQNLGQQRHNQLDKLHLPVFLQHYLLYTP